jgi:carbon storage regulator
MLVLTRKLMEKLYIGDDICVTVVRVEGGQVRLGIDAPREISVVRAELVGGREGPRLRASEPLPASPDRDRLRYSPSEAHAGDTRRRARFR